MKRKRDFTVTLLVSTYNKPDYLRQTLLSVARQTVLPDEVVIADDGSTDETRQLIDEIRTLIPIPIQRVWHPDTGFRLSEIRNKAIAAAKGEYIIQTDGDIVLGRHFVADHTAIAEHGWLVCGSRVYLGPKTTERILNKGFSRFRGLFGSQHGSFANSFRIGWLGRYLSKRYDRKATHIRGCNMAFWRQDLIAANGYNEDIVGYGAEDGEIVHRMRNGGVKNKMLKFGGIVYHLWHPLLSRDCLAANQNIHTRTKTEGITRCENGIDKYLNDKQ
ncbi:glycosyltransferase family 2 protein [uncultured Rikenella sp.]|uniref:glycosyltransferase family 2 protein n=2 Tax=uncultured Rikenella sp. TaxID=368003 RepID=UPI0026183FB3|nr:glycosyltransferase family 2 protein [uncultured Rikenella sp.]